MTALITTGAPGYALGMEIVNGLLPDPSLCDESCGAQSSN
jgi:hypothetical protein